MEAAIAIAQVHALLATRQPEPQPILRMAPQPARAPVWDDHPAKTLTVQDYDAAMDRAFTALWDAIEPDMPNRPSPATVLGWAKAAVDAFSDPTTEPS